MDGNPTEKWCYFPLRCSFKTGRKNTARGGGGGAGGGSSGIQKRKDTPNPFLCLVGEAEGANEGDDPPQPSHPNHMQLLARPNHNNEAPLGVAQHERAGANRKL